VIVVGSSLKYLFEHPIALTNWYTQITDPQGEWHFHSPFALSHDWWGIAAVALLFFPKLALGLSGFETGVAVMPLVKGKPGDDPKEPKGRIVSTRKLLITAAAVMSVYLISSSVVVACLVPPQHLVKVDAAGNELDVP